MKGLSQFNVVQNQINSSEELICPKQFLGGIVLGCGWLFVPVWRDFTHPLSKGLEALFLGTLFCVI